MRRHCLKNIALSSFTETIQSVNKALISEVCLLVFLCLKFLKHHGFDACLITNGLNFLSLALRANVAVSALHLYSPGILSLFGVCLVHQRWIKQTRFITVKHMNHPQTTKPVTNFWMDCWKLWISPVSFPVLTPLT